MEFDQNHSSQKKCDGSFHSMTSGCPAHKHIYSLTCFVFRGWIFASWLILSLLLLQQVNSYLFHSFKTKHLWNELQETGGLQRSQRGCPFLFIVYDMRGCSMGAGEKLSSLSWKAPHFVVMRMTKGNQNQTLPTLKPHKPAQCQAGKRSKSSLLTLT